MDLGTRCLSSLLRHKSELRGLGSGLREGRFCVYFRCDAGSNRISTKTAFSEKVSEKVVSVCILDAIWARIGYLQKRPSVLRLKRGPASKNVRFWGFSGIVFATVENPKNPKK